ncbi:MAG: hypothetical protein P4L03_01750 [Terracidiphilus sp.]|nr:hypothetical protein [Terracidiphilus sp.]
MQRRRATIILALAWALFSTTRPAMAQQSSATFTLELRVASPTMGDPPGIVLIVKIGKYQSRTSLIGAWGLPGLTQYFDSWREAATDILFKKLHMA